MLLDLFGKITYYPLTPAKRMTAHFYEHFLIPKRTTAVKSTSMPLLVVSDYFQAPKVKPKSKEKIIELTIHLEACKSALLTFQSTEEN